MVRQYSVSLAAQRRAVSVYFFLHGLCFSSWASRIPHLQQNLGLTDAELGLLLFAIPMGDLCTMPFSGYVAHRFGSRVLSLVSMWGYALVLGGIGWASTVSQLVVGMVALGMTSNLVNISVNTQSVIVQKQYDRSILSTFHGLWSLAGFCGALLGAAMIRLKMAPKDHFFWVALCMVLASFYFSRCLAEDRGVEKKGTSSWVWPGKTLLLLGVIGCCCMVCEGAMFDWSGIYFKKIVLAPKEWIGVGYAVFMGTMALGRFLSDAFITRYGVRTILKVSSILITSGLLVAVAWPSFVLATFGFLLVGFGVSSVVPLVYGQAGRSEKVAPPIALAAVTTVGFIGFLGGPPLIGFVSGLFDLRASFLVIAFMGMLVGIFGNRLVVK